MLTPNGGVFGRNPKFQNVTVENKLAANGDFTLTNGNVIIGTAGKGIDFSITSSGTGTMTSELLSDYEEGTFTPTIGGSTTAGTTTYLLQQGKYAKIGNVVAFQLRLGWSNITGSAGNLRIFSLPFTSSSDANYVCPISALNSGVVVGAGLQFATAIAGNSTQVTLYSTDPANGALAQIAMDTAGNLYVAGTYHV